MTGPGGAGFSLRGLVAGKIDRGGAELRRLKPAPLNPPAFSAITNQSRPVVNASVTSVFCSSSCALADPVAGLALAERFTERTGIPGI